MHKDPPRNETIQQLQAALNERWTKWAKQAAELHTYRVDLENREKDGKGFHKLNEESIVFLLSHSSFFIILPFITFNLCMT